MASPSTGATQDFDADDYFLIGGAGGFCAGGVAGALASGAGVGAGWTGMAPAGTVFSGIG